MAVHCNARCIYNHGSCYCQAEPYGIEIDETGVCTDYIDIIGRCDSCLYENTGRCIKCVDNQLWIDRYGDEEFDEDKVFTELIAKAVKVVKKAKKQFALTITEKDIIAWKNKIKR